MVSRILLYRLSEKQSLAVQSFSKRRSLIQLWDCFPTQCSCPSCIRHPLLPEPGVQRSTSFVCTGLFSDSKRWQTWNFSTRNLARALRWNVSHCKRSAIVENRKVSFLRKFEWADPAWGRGRTSVCRDTPLSAPRRCLPTEEFDFWRAYKLASPLASFLRERCTRRQRWERTWCCCRWTRWLRRWFREGPWVGDPVYPKNGFNILLNAIPWWFEILILILLLSWHPTKDISLKVWYLLHFTKIFIKI